MLILNCRDHIVINYNNIVGGLRDYFLLYIIPIHGKFILSILLNHKLVITYQVFLGCVLFVLFICLLTNKVESDSPPYKIRGALLGLLFLCKEKFPKDTRLHVLLHPNII